MYTALLLITVAHNVERIIQQPHPRHSFAAAHIVLCGGGCLSSTPHYCPRIVALPRSDALPARPFFDLLSDRFAPPRLLTPPSPSRSPQVDKPERQHHVHQFRVGFSGHRRFRGLFERDRSPSLGDPSTTQITTLFVIKDATVAILGRHQTK